jgi:polysaccharide deacetylase 2 family uncharacterized protein YibQ
MFKDSYSKAKIRFYLVVVNIILALIAASMVIYWLAFARPGQIMQATVLGHYRAYTMDNLPFITGEIEADYAGSPEAVINNSEELDRIESELAAINIDSANTTTLNSDKLLVKTEKFITQSEQLLNKKNRQKTNNTKKVRSKSAASKVSIIVTNLGLSKRSTEAALTLPPQCAFGFLPYTQNLQYLLNKAQNDGHEIYLYLPLQTNAAFNSSEKYALMNNLAPEENATRLNMVLNSQPQYKGVYSSFKEVFTNNPQSAEMLFDQLEDKNHIFILGREKMAKSKDLTGLYSNIIPTTLVIDKEPDRESIKKQLQKNQFKKQKEFSQLKKFKMGE